MSDESAPVAEASAAESAPVETKEPGAEPTEVKVVKPRTIDDDLEDVFKKHRDGAAYKSAGKEKRAKTWAEAKRVLSFADGVHEVADRTAKQAREVEAKTASIAGLAKMKPAERVKALVSMGVSKDAIREAFEEEILTEDHHQKELAALTPEQRAFRQEREAFEAERNEFTQKQQAAQQEQEEAEYVARVTQTGERLQRAAVGALTKAKIAGEHAPRFLQAIAERLDRNERLGLELDEDELADVVMKEHESMADQYYGALDLPALSEKLDAAMVEDPDKPGTKVSRLKLLMRHEAAKIRARNGGPTNGYRQAAPLPARATTEESVADKLNFWRTR